MCRINKKGKSLFVTGDQFESVFVIRSGFFKTESRGMNGYRQVVEFQMTGDLLGLDGIESDIHASDAIAIEDSIVCVLQYKQLLKLSKLVRPLSKALYQEFGREITAEQTQLTVLSVMNARQRMAYFLLNLAHRLHARGWSETVMSLRMSRREIGSYLGLTLETVSRVLTHFKELGLISVEARKIELLDVRELKAIANDI